MNNYCRICFKKIYTYPFRELKEQNLFLCDECIEKMKVNIKEKKIDDIKYLFLSDYDSFFQDILYKYKECSDVELAPCFLFLFTPLIKMKFFNHLFIPAPSSNIREKKRGFNHLEMMLKSANLNCCAALEKTDDVERKTLHGTQRFKKEEIAVKKSKHDDIKGKKIVLFDDVYTTGTTIKNCINAIKKYSPKTIKVLILLNNDSEERMQIS